jgi:predicted RNA binding protein YcfA (HicA-like mRNA interferase family)
MHYKELLNILKGDGWVEKAQKGSHLQLVHPVKIGKVTVLFIKGIFRKAPYTEFLNKQDLSKE